MIKREVFIPYFKTYVEPNKYTSSFDFIKDGTYSGKKYQIYGVGGDKKNMGENSFIIGLRSSLGGDDETMSFGNFLKNYSFAAATKKIVVKEAVDILKGRV